MLVHYFAFKIIRTDEGRFRNNVVGEASGYKAGPGEIHRVRLTQPWRPLKPQTGRAVPPFPSTITTATGRLQACGAQISGELPTRDTPLAGCYNAAMSKPFQFSMRRMFGAVGCFCVAACLFSYLLREKLSDIVVVVSLIMLGFAGIGAAVGFIVGRPVFGAFIGAAIGIAYIALTAHWRIVE
jgi:hypothetical protein